MFERPKGGERAILVQLALPNIDATTALAEFKDLAISADAEVLDMVMGSRSVPEAKYYMGLGKAEEVASLVKAHEAELVLVNHELSPSQERNLERLFQCRVVDRSGLILDIFARRARTHEGKLQVELAQLEHLSTRLVRGWTHLERQKGGIGLRGPGETQLETDRRLLRERIRAINKRLEKVRQSREQNRLARQKAALPTVSLVGYTNAGKSTLFNSLTGEGIFAADQLFATLDPTMRRLNLPGSDPVVLADTVGFIRDLPHHLVKAFRATLEETRQADLLLHVIDVSDPLWRERVSAVEQVLADLDVQDIPLIQVYNKIDFQDGFKANVDTDGQYPKVWISAKEGLGLDALKSQIAEKLFGGMIKRQLILNADAGKMRSKLYQLKAVQSETMDDEGRFILEICMTKAQWQALLNSSMLNKM